MFLQGRAAELVAILSRRSQTHVAAGPALAFVPTPAYYSVQRDVKMRRKAGGPSALMWLVQA